MESFGISLQGSQVEYTKGLKLRYESVRSFPRGKRFRVLEKDLNGKK